MISKILSITSAFLITLGSALASDTEPELPKQIHYIWVGGPIYKEYWDDLTTMASLTQSEGYQVNLWVEDPQNARFVRERVKLNQQWYELGSNTRNKLMNESYDLYVNKLKLVHICDVNKLRAKTPDFLSPQDHQSFWHYLDTELVGLKNLGAYSDMLRYLILAQEGGIYLDTDSTPLITCAWKPLDHRVAVLGSVLPDSEDFLCLGTGNSILIGKTGNKVCVDAVHKCLANYRRYEIRPHEKAQNQTIPGLEAKRSILSAELKEEEKYKDRGALTIYMSGPSLLSSCLHPRQVRPESGGELTKVNFWKAKLELPLVDADPQHKLNNSPPVIYMSRPMEIMIAELMGKKYPNYDATSRREITGICQYLFNRPQLPCLEESQLTIVKDLLSYVREDVASVHFVRMGDRMLIHYKCDTSWGSRSKPRPFDDATVSLPAGQYLYTYSIE